MLKLTVLVDNHTYIDQYYLGEPAVSYYLQDGDFTALFDAGYSDVYLRNAAAMGLALPKVDAVVLSHGHNDHTGGLKYFPDGVEKPKLVGHPDVVKPKLVAHPDIVKPKLVGHPDILEPKRMGALDIGCPVAAAELAQKFTLAFSREPVALTQNLWFLGQVPRITTFENQQPVGEHLVAGAWQPDFVRDDSALVYKSDAGLVVITGCSHAGICNICEYAKKVTGEEKLRAIIGGFHLAENATAEQLTGTIAYFKQQPALELYPCHCTCFAARAKMFASLPVHEVGVGMHCSW